MMNARRQRMEELFQHDQEHLSLLTTLHSLEQEIAGARAVPPLAATRLTVNKHLKDAREAASDLAWELEDVELTLRSLTTTHDLAIDREARQMVAELRQRKAALEDDVLQQLERIEALEREQQLAEAEWLRHTATVAERSGSLRAEQHRLTAALEAVNVRRESAIAMLDDADRRAYRRAVELHQQEPWSHLHDLECLACQATVPVQIVETLPQPCPACARILLPDR